MHLVRSLMAFGEPINPNDPRHRSEWVSRARLAAVSTVERIRDQQDSGFELMVPEAAEDRRG